MEHAGLSSTLAWTKESIIGKLLAIADSLHSPPPPPPPPPTLAQAREAARQLGGENAAIVHAFLATAGGEDPAMSDLARTLLPLRGRVPDRVLLDCLELAEHVGPRSLAGPYPRITSAELQARWICTQPWVCRRMAALQHYQLLDATTRTGPGAHWVITRLGPVA